VKKYPIIGQRHQISAISLFRFGTISRITASVEVETGDLVCVVDFRIHSNSYIGYIK